MKRVVDRPYVMACVRPGKLTAPELVQLLLYLRVALGPMSTFTIKSEINERAYKHF